MKRNANILLLYALLVVAGCTMEEQYVDNEQNEIPEEQITLQASRESGPETRTVRDESNGDVLWAPGDAISLFYGRPIDDFAGYYDDCQALIRTVMDAFEEKYGSVLCCDVLTHNLGAPYDWKTEEGFRAYNEHNGTPHDAEVVAFCTDIVARMLVDGKLQYGEDLRPEVDNPYYKSPNTLKKIEARNARIAARKAAEGK